MVGTLTQWVSAYKTLSMFYLDKWRGPDDIICNLANHSTGNTTTHLQLGELHSMALKDDFTTFIFKESVLINGQDNIAQVCLLRALGS